MPRHTLFVRYGADDPAKPITESNTFLHELNFVKIDNRFDYRIGKTLDRLLELDLQPTEPAIDLLILASSVYCADTRISRTHESQDSWTREISLQIPVNDPHLWNDLVPLLRISLEFLTGDKWSFYFRPRPPRFKTIARPPKKPGEKSPSCISLFSGGLDSFIGAIDLLAAGEFPVLISHSWVGNASKHQSLCIKSLIKAFGADRILRLRSTIGFPEKMIEGLGQENTERSRSFLFFSLAALAASSLTGKTTIYVPENGLITLNVPLDPSRIGSLSTRTTHPYFIARFNNILNHLGIMTLLKNPYRHKTKGEMTAQCLDQALLKGTHALTISCSSPNKGRFHGDAPGHCGYCVPCIIRRAALEQWEHPDSTTYALQNLKSSILCSNSAKGKQIRSFQLAIKRLKNDLNRARVMIHEPGPLTDDIDGIEGYARVYLYGMKEVEHLLKGVRTMPNV
jgi:7-cyano-7-deazaguanine synthase in queuosine biosynthesis